MIFVIGSVNPNAITPNKPNSIPLVSVFKKISLMNLQFRGQLPPYIKVTG